MQIVFMPVLRCCIIRKLPVSDILYVGRSTNRTLSKYGIHTIGDLACTDPDLLKKQLGKMGLVIYSFANGWDESPVAPEGYSAPIKSIGNSTTTPRDLENNLDVQIIFMALAESVSARLRKHGFKCNTVAISIRDNGLYHFSRQMHLQEPTDITDEIMKAAMELFRDNYDWSHPIRSLGVRGADLVTTDISVQMSLFMNEEKRARQEKMDKAVDEIRRRFGYFSIQRAFVWEDGRKYEIDKVKSKERCASRKAGGTGIMYTVVVAGKECHVYFEFDKWFMERKIA